MMTILPPFWRDFFYALFDACSNCWDDDETEAAA